MIRKCVPCDAMIFHCHDSTLPLNFNPIFDEFFINRSGSSVQVLNFCPFCGGQLPVSRRDQFFEELDSQGIDFAVGDDISKLPARYRKARWWED
jgi:hypothetical protein